MNDGDIVTPRPDSLDPAMDEAADSSLTSERQQSAPAAQQRPGAVTEGDVFDEQQTLLPDAFRLAVLLLEAAMKRDTSYQLDTLLGPHVRDYLAYLGRRRKQRTIDSYEETLVYLCTDEVLKNLELNEVTYNDLRSFIDRRWGGTNPRTGKPYSIATERQRTAAVKGFFKWADERAELLTGKNPARKLDPPPLRDEDTQPHRRLEDWESERLISAQPKIQDRIALQLADYLSFRRNELRLFQLQHFTVQTGAILVMHGKGGKRRNLFTTQQLQSDLEEYIVWGEHRPEEYLLRPWDRGFDPYQPQSMHNWFKNCVARAELDPAISLHDLRYTGATRFYEATKDIVRTQLFLGHTDSKTTIRYLDLADEVLKAAIRELG